MEIFTMLYIPVILLLSFESPTILKFSEEIEFFSIGKAREFQSYKSKDGKILAIKPSLKEFETKMVVITKGGHYQFKLKSSLEDTPSLYLIKKGEINSKYILKRKSTNWSYFDGESSSMLINRTGKPLKVNGVLKKEKKIYLPKGGEIFINGEKL